MPTSDRVPTERIHHIRQALKRVTDDFMARRNVVACGIGFKTQRYEQTDVPGLIVSVTRKVSMDELSADALIPQMVDDVPTDIVETGTIVPLGLNRWSALRPARPGMSIGHENGSAGTLGCIVRRGIRSYVLSNNHVLALLNQASLGDPILQPGASDGGTLVDQIGELDAFIPLRFLDEYPSAEPVVEEPQGCLAQLISLFSAVRPTTAEPVPLPPAALPDNVCDAALARPLDDSLISPDIIDMGGPPLGMTEPRLGMRVVKSGRTTGLTQGLITQTDVTVNVKYGDRAARFTDQMMITPFSERGDSGSLVLDYERRAVGLLFSGSGQVTVANPIQSVLAALEVDLVIAG